MAISALVLACVLLGAVVGMFLRSVLPKHHLGDDSKDMIKLGIGLIATLVALVLGLLVASAKSSFDTKADEIKQGAAQIVLLDKALRRFGPEAAPARELLRRTVATKLEAPWGEATIRSLSGAPPPGVATLEEVQERIRILAPANDDQRWLKDRALQLSTQLMQTRWLLVEQAGSSISAPFLVVVVSWLTVIFASFGLFAPRNGTVLAVILLCAVSVSTAVFLILELDRPFQGLIVLPQEPLRQALSALDG